MHEDQFCNFEMSKDNYIDSLMSYHYAGIVRHGNMEDPVKGDEGFGKD